MPYDLIWARLGLAVALLGCLCIISLLILHATIRKDSFEVKVRGFTNTAQIALSASALYLLVIYETISILTLYSEDQTFQAVTAGNCKVVSLAQNLLLPINLFCVQKQFYNFTRYSTKNQLADKHRMVGIVESNAQSSSTRWAKAYVLRAVAGLILIFWVTWIVLYSPTDYESQHACLSDLALVLPSLIAIALSITSALIVVYRLRRFENNFGMRRECVIYTLADVVFTGVTMTLNLVDSVSSYQVNLVVASCPLVHSYYCLAAPFERHVGWTLASRVALVAKYLFKRGVKVPFKSLFVKVDPPMSLESLNNRSEMRRLLSYPMIRAEIERFGTQQCCPENLLFYQAYEDLRSKPSVDQKTLQALHHTFTKVGSQFELNLVSATYSQMRTKSAAGTLCLADFATVNAEVETSIFDYLHQIPAEGFYGEVYQEIHAECTSIDTEFCCGGW